MHPVDDLYVIHDRLPDRQEYRKRQHSDSSDDDASSPKSYSPSFDDGRRAHHNELERRRRDHIKDHFMILKDAIPLLDGEKSSRALILKRAVEYIGAMQLRISENHRSIEELRRRNELLEEKLRENHKKSSSSRQQFQNLPNMIRASHIIPAHSIPHNVTPSSLSTMDPVQLNHLIATSQEAIVALTQSLLGKMHTSPPMVPLASPPMYPNVFAQSHDRQMSVRLS